MDLSGWTLDLPSVYGGLWEKRDRFPLTERLYESPDGRWALLLFGLGEVGLNKQVGPLALFRDKASPTLVYHSGSTAFWFEGIAGDPVTFAPDGRTARVFEFVRDRPNELGVRERTLDFASGRLLPLPGRPTTLRERWRSFRSRHKVLAFLLFVLLTGAALAPWVLIVDVVLEHRRDADLSARGREIAGTVEEFPGPASTWSRVRVEAAPGSTTTYVVHERLPAGRAVTLLQDPATGEIRAKDDVVRRLSSWPWNLITGLVFLSPLYLGIPWAFWWLGRHS